jgi:16S rRNA (guanine527-N7)-methyltransferase
MSLKFPREACAARLRAGLDEIELDLSIATQNQLLDYLALLDQWNQTYNLTAIRKPLEMVDKHLLDSLSLLPHVEDAPLLDVGAGAGLPGLVLAMIRPAANVTLVDAVAKKVNFMQHVIRTLKLPNARAIHSRIEDLDGQHARYYAQITSRAFSNLAEFVTLTRPLLAQGGTWLAMKGQIPQDELTQLPAWVEIVAMPQLRVPSMLGERHLIVLQQRDQP